MRLPADATAPAVARQAVTERLRACRCAVLHDARSVVSELVTRALRHGRPPIQLSISTSGGWARIAISDAGVAHGRRLTEYWSQLIIDRLGRTVVRADDQRVWFEVPVDASASCGS
jgi:hypothetical protein